MKDIKISLKKKNSSKRCQNFTEVKKEKNHQYGRDNNKNLSEDQKEKLIEYSINYYLAYKK